MYILRIFPPGTVKVEAEAGGGKSRCEEKGRREEKGEREEDDSTGR